MKRVIIVAFLPLVLFGLETVNLIKDAGFEKDSEVWLMGTEVYMDLEHDSTKINRQETDSVYVGNFCGSIDTRTRPVEDLAGDYFIKGYFCQLFSTPKKLEDLDSLQVYHMCLFPVEYAKYTAFEYGVYLSFYDPSIEDRVNVYYPWLVPGLTFPADDLNRKSFPDTIGSEGDWFGLERDIGTDLNEIKKLPLDIELDSFLMYCNSYYLNNGPWYGEKAFFDDIRLMGYADYDVGVKEILSGDSLEVGTPYQPVARIKNFGRENADSFLVMAEIWDGSSLIYVDTLPWTLEGDTEDTVTFADFDPPFTGPYTLTVRTHMTSPEAIDECDEDDKVTKEIGHTAIEEKPTPDDLSLEVRFIASPLQVSYALPYGEHGTLTLFDATGRRIERMAVKGSGKVEFSDLPSGAYFIIVEANDISVVEKAIVLQ